MRNTEWYVADFETTTEQTFIEKGYTEVWLYAISNPLGDIINWGKSINEFIENIKKLKNNALIYFHNLKFDGSFLLNYLLEQNFTYYEEKMTNKSPNKIFSTLIDDMGMFYSIQVKFENGIIIKFNDSLKLLPFSVEKIAKDFGLPMIKGSIDYDDYTINDVTLEYVFNDVRIVALALQQIKELGMTRMTTAGCAFNEFSSAYQYMDLDFPQCNKDMLIEWREAYRGGRSQVNPKFANEVLYGVKRYDINSMYPYIMHDLPLPYGKPIPIEIKGLYKFEIYKLKLGFRLKKGHLPTLLKKGSLYTGDDTYYIETDDIELIYITSIDYELLRRHYDIWYEEVVEMYGFKTSRNMFKSYIDKWYEIKNNNKGAKKIVAKTMLNSLYGKFGSKPVGRHKIPKLDDGLCFEYSKEEDLKIYYLWLAMAVTSHAHKLLDDNIMASGVENFVYCDTDSIHTLGDLPPEIVDNKELGKFKLEAVEKRSKYVRQKCYVVQEEDNTMTITCAGMPQRLKDAAIKGYGVTLFEVFKVGFKMGGKLLPKQVRGGVILRETTFEIK